MNISPETKRISEIFSIEGSHKYQIPVYQRNYSWGTKQIDTLISDISDEDSGYYIGNLLITTSDNKTNEIVDGQQRLTTVAIIFIAIYEIISDLLETDKNKDNQRKMASIQEDIKRKLLVSGNHREPRYTLLDDDHIIFWDLLKIVVQKTPKKWGNRRFGKRFKETKNILKEYFDDFYKLIVFYDKLNSVEILKITVTNLSDAFSVFSALNSKGLPLTLIDLLKNEYLKHATFEGRDSLTALNKWRELVENFRFEQDVDTKLITQFLLNNYDAFENKVNSSITKSKALDVYTELLSDYKSTYIEKLNHRSKWFMFIVQGNIDLYPNNEINRLIKDLDYLDISQAYPLLLYTFVDKDLLELNEDYLIEILASIKKFYMIRNVTLRPKSSNIRSMFVGLNRKISNQNLKGYGIVEVVKQELSDKSDSIKEFKSELIHEGIYDKSRQTTRFLLIELERKFGTFFSKAVSDSLEAYVPSKSLKNPKLNWTIEHVLPQGDNLPEHWIKMLNEYGEPQRVQEEHCHKIGNLTLSPYNSELGQSDFKTKMDKTEKGQYVGLRLGLYLNSTFLTDEKDTWLPEDINRRSEQLAEKLSELVKIY